jgi:hypothetical protein
MTPSLPDCYPDPRWQPRPCSRGKGSYAHDPTMLNAFLSADGTIERIADLLEADLP